MRFKIDWASLIGGSKFTVFALVYFVFEGNFPSTSPWGGLYLEGLIHGMEGLIFGTSWYFKEKLDADAGVTKGVRTLG